MAVQDIVTLDTSVPGSERLEVPQTGDTYNAPRAITVNPVALTGSTATPALDISQTWNTTGTPTGIRLSVTDTASNAASNLLELRGGAAGTTTLAKIDKVGDVRFGAFGTQAYGSGFIVTTNTAGNAYSGYWGSDRLQVGPALSISWGTSGYGGTDLNLFRDDADALAQRRSTIAQVFRVYNATNSITGGAPTNFDRAYMRWSSNILQIGTEIGGTYLTPRSLALQTNGTTRLTLGATDGAATFTGSLTSGPATFNGASSTIASFQDISTGSIFSVNNSAATALLDVTDVTTGNLLSVVNAGGTTVFNVTDAGVVRIPSGAALTYGSATNITATDSGPFPLLTFTVGSTAPLAIRPTYLSLGSSATIAWSPGGAGAASEDLTLARDDANILAQRNGDNGQIFRVYGRGGGTANFERFFVNAPTTAGAAVQLGTQKGGTGTARALEFQTDGVTRLTISTAGNATFSGGSTFGGSVGFNSNSIGYFLGSGYDTSILRAAAGIVAIRAATSATGGALSFIEQTAPAAPAANGVYIYAEDDGAGKTRLMALFATGAAQQLAIEP